MVAAYLLSGLVLGCVVYIVLRVAADALADRDDPALSSYLLAARVTQPANPIKAQRTWRRSMRIYINTRKGEV
jgi:hypothetical protein